MSQKANSRSPAAATIAGPFIRDIVFGVHDALLTNIGIITGFVVALQDNRVIIVAAVIDIVVSAFAMAFGTYLSRTSESAYLASQLRTEHQAGLQMIGANPITAAIVMWVSYALAGIIPLLPFFFHLDPSRALSYAIVLALFVFLGIGMFKGYLTKTSIWRSGLQFVAFGSIAAAIGYTIGFYGEQLIPRS